MLLIRSRCQVLILVLNAIRSQWNPCGRSNSSDFKSRSSVLQDDVDIRPTHLLEKATFEFGVSPVSVAALKRRMPASKSQHARPPERCAFASSNRLNE